MQCLSGLLQLGFELKGGGEPKWQGTEMARERNGIKTDVSGLKCQVFYYIRIKKNF